MPLSTSQVRVGVSGSLYLAPVGTAFPADVTAAPATAWVEMGFLSEEGVTLAPTIGASDIKAWQTLYPVRRIVTERGLDFKFKLMQRNIEAMRLTFGGGTITEVTPNVLFRYTPPSAGATDDRAAIIEIRDGTITDRYLIDRCTVTEVGDIELKRDGAAMFDLTMSILGDPAGLDPWVMLTNDPAMDPTP